MRLPSSSPQAREASSKQASRRCESWCRVRRRRIGSRSQPVRKINAIRALGATAIVLMNVSGADPCGTLLVYGERVLPELWAVDQALSAPATGPTGAPLYLE